jgi:hypothetical protein
VIQAEDVLKALGWDELLDRAMVDRLKYERTGSVAHLERSKLLTEYLDQVWPKESRKENFSAMIDLSLIHQAIWDEEAGIRAGLDNEMSDAEIGDRALRVRDYNGQRTSIKARIARATGSGIQNIKVNHAFEKLITAPESKKSD